MDKLEHKKKRVAQKMGWQKEIDEVRNKLKGAHKDVGWNKTFGYHRHSNVSGFLESVDKKTGKFKNPKHEGKGDKNDKSNWYKDYQGQ